MKLFNRIKDTVACRREEARPPAAQERPPQTDGVASSPDPSGPVPPPRRRKRRLLFVEGDAVALRDLSRLLEPLRDQWDMVFAVNTSEALAAMEREPFDVIVAALGLSGTTGVGFLNEATKRHSKALRFIRCTPQERKDLKGFVGAAPQHFSTELDAEGAQQVVHRAVQVEEWFSQDAIKALLSKLHKLPALPALYTQILNELQSPSVAIDAVAQLIAKDPVITAKMLQLVNSAYFALPREVTDSVEAVMFLGAERTRSLILLAKVFSQFDQHLCKGFQLDELWRHSLAVGSYAHLICQAERKDTRMADQAFTGGLLHDVGKLLLAGNLPERYAQVLDQAKRRKLPVREVEMEVFGTSHAELGACLLGTWGLPLGILEAMAWHNRPTLSEDTDFSLLTAVHVANAIDHEKKSEAADILVTQIDSHYVQRLNLGGHRNRWRLLCESPIKEVDEVAPTG